MIKLKDLILKESSFLKNEENDIKKEELIPTENWKITHAMFLEDMGFKNDGMFYYALKKPEIKICFQKGVGFILNDKSKKQKHTFKTFKELEQYFENYEQEWEREPYL